MTQHCNNLSQYTVDNIVFSSVTVSSSKCVLGPQSQTWKLRGCVFIHFPLSSPLSLFAQRMQTQESYQYLHNNSRYLVNSIDESSNADSPQLESTFTVYKVGTFTIFCVVDFRKILQGFKTL